MREIVAKELASVGIPLRELEKRLGGHYVHYKRLAEGLSCRGCRRLLAELSEEEFSALKGLLRHVPARFVVRWLGICFRFRRCRKAQKKPLSRGA